MLSVTNLLLTLIHTVWPVLQIQGFDRCVHIVQHTLSCMCCLKLWYTRSKEPCIHCVCCHAFLFMFENNATY